MSVLEKLQRVGAQIAARNAEAKVPAAPPAVDPVIAEAARLLGMKPSEITGVRDEARGTIVTTFDGHETIVVPDDKPDDDGKVGVMSLHARPGLKGPVYVPHGTRSEREKEERRQKREEAKRLAEAEAARAAEPTSPDLEVLMAKLAEVEADPARAGRNSHQARTLRVLIAGEKAKLAVQVPPDGPSQREIARWVGIGGWARAMRDAATPREQRDAMRAWVRKVPEVQTWSTTDRALEREARAAETWLRSHGLDDDGNPVT